MSCNGRDSHSLGIRADSSGTSRYSQSWTGWPPTSPTRGSLWSGTTAGTAMPVGGNARRRTDKSRRSCQRSASRSHRLPSRGRSSSAGRTSAKGSMRRIRYSAHGAEAACRSLHALTSPRASRRSSPTSDSVPAARLARRRGPLRNAIWPAPHLALVPELLGAVMSHLCVATPPSVAE